MSDKNKWGTRDQILGCSRFFDPRDLAYVSSFVSSRCLDTVFASSWRLLSCFCSVLMALPCRTWKSPLHTYTNEIAKRILGYLCIPRDTAAEIRSRWWSHVCLAKTRVLGGRRIRIVRRRELIASSFAAGAWTHVVQNGTKHLYIIHSTGHRQMRGIGRQIARRTPHAARRTPHTTHHTPHAARHTPHTTYVLVVWGVRRGAWGVGRVVCGVRRVACGVGRVVCGVRRVVCGVWCVVCGVWCVACGVWYIRYCCSPLKSSQTPRS